MRNASGLKSSVRIHGRTFRSGTRSFCRSSSRIFCTRRMRRIRFTFPHAEPGNAVQPVPWRAIDIDGKPIAMTQRPGQFRIDRQIEIRRIRRRDLADAKFVKAHQPIGLIQPMFTHQRRRLSRQSCIPVGNRTERGIINTSQTVSRVERRRRIEDHSVAARRRADDHLRALASGGVGRGVAAFTPFGF